MGRTGIHITVFLVVICLTSALADTSDLSALLALKSSISFSSNNIFLEKNWSSTPSVCSWMGVFCNPANNRVDSLDISGLSLIGSIPPELGNLSFLIALNMRNNFFYGTLPEELARLQHLYAIDLSGNNLTGTIPGSFFRSLPELRILALARNAFSGSIPSFISNMSKMQQLSLAQNFLQGSIPREIGDLRFLTYLNLQANQLTGPIPPSIFNLSLLQDVAFTENYLSGNLPEDLCSNAPELKGLYLSGNEFYGLIPPSLGKCTQLQVLDLSHNKFVGNIPSELGNLTGLTWLTLGNNNLGGPIPNEIGNLRRLEVFAINENQINGSIPESIFNISTLQFFTFAVNYLSGGLPHSMGKGVPNLEVLYLGGNQLSGNIPNSISNASKLTLLSLSTNFFSGPIPTSLGNLVSLEFLNLQDNNLTTESSLSEMSFLTSLTNCRNLTKLTIHYNPLNGILPASIGNLTSLEEFNARSCKISGYIPEEIGQLSKLVKLSLPDNDLTGFIPKTVGSLQNLQQFHLEGNWITGTFPDTICTLPKLGYLNLGWNRISGSIPSCIGNLTSLRNLELGSNNFNSTLPSSLWGLKDLLTFDVSSNSLTGHLPTEIGNLKVSILIDLSKNNFSRNIPNSVDSLQNLITLSLAYNELEGPIPESFSKMLSLESLELSNNRLAGVIPQSLQALLYLKQLNVSFNKLSGKIPSSGPFRNFTAESFLSNAALCGAPQFRVPPCPTVPPHRREKSLLLVMYILLGCGCASAAVGSFIWNLLIRWKMRNRTSSQTIPSPAITHGTISYHELEKITQGFSDSNLLGTGSSSLVYKGILRDGTISAVKVFNLKSEGALKIFYTECEILGHLRHRNLIKVITSCSTPDTCFGALVIEYMQNGTLEKWLYSDQHFLDTLQRLNIMIDIASALDYLHNGYDSPVVHCDVKPSNILLDKDMVGHVGDFGIAKLLGSGSDGTVHTKTLATMGYIAPEFGLEGLVSTKCDVYSYGIVLMETFSRRRPSDDIFSGDMTLRHWIKSSFPSAVMQVVDSSLLNPEDENFNAQVECVISVMKVSLVCTETSPDARTNIQDVVSALQKVKTQFLSSSSSCKKNKVLHSLPQNSMHQ